MEPHITINWTAYVLQLTATNSSCPWSFPLTVGTWPNEGYRQLQWLELIKPWLCSKLDESYANDLAVGNVDTKSGKKINSYPNFWKVCGFSYSSITSSQSYKCQQKLLPCEFMERAYKNYRKGSSVTGRIAPACKSSLRITRCKKSGRLAREDACSIMGMFGA